MWEVSCYITMPHVHYKHTQSLMHACMIAYVHTHTHTLAGVEMETQPKWLLLIHCILLDASAPHAPPSSPLSLLPSHTPKPLTFVGFILTAEDSSHLYCTTLNFHQVSLPACLASLPACLASLPACLAMVTFVTCSEAHPLWIRFHVQCLS